MSKMYDLSAPRTVSLANYVFYKEGAVHPDRIMTEHDLIYILEGKWEILQGAQTIQAGPGDVVFLHAGAHHSGKRPCLPGTKTMFIHMSRAPLDLQSSNSPDLSKRIYIHALTHCQNHAQIKMIFEEVIQTYWSNSAIRQLKISALCQYLFCELCRTDSSGFSNSLAEQTAKLIHANPHTLLTSADLSGMLYISERTIRNAFIAAYQKTPLQYQMEFKLNSACSLMAMNPSMPFKVIAANLGFCDEFHFSKAFKNFGVNRLHGINGTPSRPNQGQGQIVPTKTFQIKSLINRRIPHSDPGLSGHPTAFRHNPLII